MKISIIIPIYNSEETIERCINSILEQTYSNYEIIIINDGSTDSTTNKINKYLKMNKNIYIYNQKNCGVSISRNKGIKLATGDYIMFIDSDDYIDTTFIEKMVSKLDVNTNQLIISGLICESNKETINKYIPNDTSILTSDCLILLNNSNYIPLFAGPVFKLFNRKILLNNNVLFPENMSLGEDTCFVLKYLKHIDRITFVNDVFYHAVIRNNSLSHKNHDNIWEIQEKILLEYTNLLSSINNKKEEYTKYSYFYFRSVKIALNYSINYKWDKKDYIKLCESITESDYFRYISKPKGIYNVLIYRLLKDRKFEIIRMLLILKKILKGVI